MSIFRLKVIPVLSFSLIAFALVGIVSCSSSPNIVEIKVHMNDAKHKWLFLYMWDGFKNSAIDSVEANSKGKATFKFTTSTPEVLAISTDKITFPILLAVKPAERISISGSLIDHRIVGSKESASIKQVQDKLDEYTAELNRLKNSLPDSITSFSTDSLVNDINVRIGFLNNEAREFGLTYIKSNLFSLSTLFVITARFDAENELFPYNQYRNYYLKLDSCLRKVYPDKPILKSFQDYIYSKEKFYSVDRNAVNIQVGSVIPPVSFTLVDGRTVNIPGVWAKLILVDFWADWCSQCHGQPLKLKQIYKDYEKKGLVIIQVAADFNSDSLLSITTRDSLNWINMAEVDPYNSALFRSLGIVNLPTNFLVDRWGRVIAKNVYGDSLSYKLTEILDRPIKVSPTKNLSRLNADSINSPVLLRKISTDPLKTSVTEDTIKIR